MALQKQAMPTILPELSVAALYLLKNNVMQNGFTAETTGRLLLEPVIEVFGRSMRIKMDILTH